tara:strand:- start:139 stop:561 length:423 start_codon:yes stop_codon:yes gene_type:complete
MDNQDDPPKQQDAHNGVVKRKRGRPKKGEVVSKTSGSRGKVGRPKGDASIINEYKARMLASPKSRKVLDSIFDAALNDDHKNQAAAWKLVMDRMLPLSYFEKDSAGGRSAVSITISGIGSGSVETDVTPKDPIEGEYTDV